MSSSPRSPNRRLLVAVAGGVLAGWVHLQRRPNPLIAHWGSISHLQTLPAFRGQGIGGALMTHARQVARQEMGLEQLHLAARGGMGLEHFYARLGWRETGRWPGALRLAPGDDCDEILMVVIPVVTQRTRATRMCGRSSYMAAMHDYADWPTDRQRNWLTPVPMRRNFPIDNRSPIRRSARLRLWVPLARAAPERSLWAGQRCSYPRRCRSSLSFRGVQP